MTFSIKILTVTLGVIMGLGLSVPKSFAFNDDEQSEIEAIVHNYLIENPQILEEMIAAMKFQEAFSAQKKAKDIIVEKYDAIFYPGAAFVTGNPKGDVTLVEFFDYTCSFCRKSLPDLEKLINTDPNLRVVFIDFPALSGRNPTSMVAARASVAAAQQEGKYAAYHFKMMGTKSGLTEKAIVRIAGEVGLNVEQLTKDMNAPETYARIDANMELARDLGIDGTPTFIVGDQVIAGAVGYDLLKAEIDEVRRKAAAAKTKAD